MKVIVHNEGPLPGLEALLPADVNPTPSALAELTERVDALGIPMERVMGLSETLSSVVNWFRRRRLVKTLCNQSCRITWLELHVPKNGSACFSSTAASGGEVSIDLSLFGSGFGGGCKARICVEESTEKYVECIRRVLVVSARPEIYEVDGRQSAVLQVVGVEGEIWETFGPCPYCGISPSTIDRFTYLPGLFVDLRRDVGRHQRSFEVTRTADLNLKVGVQIPGLANLLSISGKLISDAAIKLSYELAPGYLYQPYQRVDGTPPHTPMWAVESA